MISSQIASATSWLNVLGLPPSSRCGVDVLPGLAAILIGSRLCFVGQPKRFGLLHELLPGAARFAARTITSGIENGSTAPLFDPHAAPAHRRTPQSGMLWIIA
jgi:hypothetical protein